MRFRGFVRDPKNSSWPQMAQNSQKRNNILAPKILSPF